MFRSSTERRARRLLHLARLALLAPLMALASGCATYMSAQVTSFHQLSPDRQLAGKRFVIEPSTDQQDSLEFRAYADLVRQALIRNGLVDAGDASAELAVAIRYSIDNGKPVTYSYPAYGYANFGPVWGWAPYRSHGGVHYAWTATYPVSYGVIGTNYGQSTTYRRELRVDITDRSGKASGGRAGSGTITPPGGAFAPARVFEGTVVTQGESGSLAPVMPAMVRALFSEFPGANGATRLVQVTLDEDEAADPPAVKPK